ncbi:ABC transporter permease [Flavitalea sp. BT771]|uniref:ABC transporter permease n=1 Tax=Flavitalea sp. BT771 TaxID=3063329 RepID=UPI0026E23F2C|nr:ABC transporter permease [Flavitalea sp. BT771]MDO6432718.1 ABC transporter permease [Flavitalea sp. BT771]MDV6222006.1 FtsX-like permease family protein [Flavitalea sp. BT771]
MLKSYFLVAIRSFWRNKTFSLINILGLSIGISASLIIFLLVHFDFSFDKFEKDGARIYRVVLDAKNDGQLSYNNCLPVPMGPAIQKELTGIELVAPFRTLDELKVTIPGADASRPLVLKKQKDLVYADARYCKLLNYTWLAGSTATSLEAPYQVVLTEKNARIYYPGLRYGDIIGRSIAFDDTIQATITGIVKDLSDNSDFYFGGFISLSTLYTSRLKPDDINNWGSINSADQLFVRLSPGTTTAAVNVQLDRLLKKYNPPNEHGGINCHLQPLADLHFNPHYGVFDESRQAHKPTLYGLLAVAAFLLLLACINFINLTTAQASLRAKEIGIRKTMGGHRRQLALQFLSETFLLTLIATLLSIALVPWLLKVFADFIPEDFHINVFHQPEVIGFLLALVAAVSLLSGLYPAFVLSAYKPVLVLKNQANASTAQTRSSWLRKTLTVSQFVIAQVFIIATLLVTKQISYGLHKDLGFKKDAILTFRTNYAETTPKRALLLSKLKALPGIVLVSQSSDAPSSNGTWTSGMSYNDGKKEIQKNVQVKLGDSNYFRIYKFRLLAGAPAPQSDTTNAVVINESYMHFLGFQHPEDAVGQQINWNGKVRITGVVADFHQRSLHDAIIPLVIANGTRKATVFNIALQPQNPSAWPKTIAAMEKAFKSVYPNDDFEYRFIDDTIAKFYTAEKNIARLLAWATGLTIFISCLGLLGLVIYITNQRTKEIGIRKVIGATVVQLIFLLSRDFLKLIGLAILIALPIAWWGSRKWLENFTYRTQLSWWVFAAGGGALLFIALAILCLRTFKAAAMNPVESLRSE